MTFDNTERQTTLRRGTSNVRVFSGLLVLFAAIVLLWGSTASAQLTGKGEIKGVVTDPSGAVVPGAIVTATSTTQGTKITRTTSSSGDFDLPSLNPDIYRVTITAKGFQTLTQENVHVNALEVSDLPLTMTIGSESQSIDVSTAPPALETSNATLGATMENDVYSALPIELGSYGSPDQRRATDFAFLMPGVQGNNTTGNPTTNVGIVDGSGSRGAVTAIYIDGVPFVRAGGNGDPRFVWTAISVDAVDQFQVLTSGYSAIYEGQGVQNYNIKLGGNKYHGSVYEFFRNTALDTWGFFGANNLNPATGLPIKPIEHSNEYGINLSGPLIPVGTWREKLFFFGNYSGFRYSSQTPTSLTFPTANQQAGNFQGLQTGGIFDPFTQAQCTANSSNGPCRYRYGTGPGAGVGPAGNPVSLCPANPAGCLDIIPSSEFSAVALKLQSFLPGGIGTTAQNNFISPNPNGLVNWSTTERIDYNINSKDTLSLISAIGRQASVGPAGQTTAGRNVGPVPYNYGQVFAPKTAVGVIEETHVFSPNIVNQFKYGFARYNGPTFQPNEAPAYAAATQGIAGLPAGQGAGAFPIVTFAGTNPVTNWAGQVANVTIAQNYTLLDNVQWNRGRHSFTFGGQIAWLQYQVTPDIGGSSPLTIAAAVTETAALNKSSNASPSYAATANTGLSYASFLIGENDKGSLTQNVVQEYGSRFRAISPYVQDNWRVSSKLTLDLGLRWDYFPSLREAHDSQSLLQPQSGQPDLRGQRRFGVHRDRNQHLQLSFAGEQLLQELRSAPWSCLSGRSEDSYPHQLCCDIYARQRGGWRRFYRWSSWQHSRLCGEPELRGEWSAAVDVPAYRNRRRVSGLRASAGTGFGAVFWYGLYDNQWLYRYTVLDQLLRSVSGWPGAGVHRLDLRLPAPVDRRHYVEHHVCRITGALPSRRRDERSRLLGKPAGSEVPWAGIDSEHGRYRGLRGQRSYLPGALHDRPTTECGPQALPVCHHYRSVR